MGKRSNFKRNPRDYYRTPEKAVYPLIPHLSAARYKNFAEPCAGDGYLSSHLYRLARLPPYWESDIEPQSAHINKVNALALTRPLEWAECIITNPPWDRKILHPMIDHFKRYAPTWLLFDADWMHTKQARPYLEYCHKIVSVGRVSWMENSISGKDNCCWYLFDKDKAETVFYASD